MPQGIRPSTAQHSAAQDSNPAHTFPADAVKGASLQVSLETAADQRQLLGEFCCNR
jgi:hypothetical protein